MIINKTKIAILAPVLLLAILAGYLWQTGFLSRLHKPYSGSVEKVTISTVMFDLSALLFVAEEKGYFLHNGLEVTLKYFPAGKMGLDELKARRIDIANIADFVLVEEIIKGTEYLRCLGEIARGDNIYILTRKSRGILQPGDLKGKRIGAPQRTIADFFLGRFLTLHHLSYRDIEVVNLSPADMAEALANGRVDAVITWTPFAYHIQKQPGEEIVVWPGQGWHPYHWLLVCRDEFIKASPEVLERLFRALAQAERFIKSNAEASIDIAVRRIKIDRDFFKSHWRKNTYALSFDQSLLLTMEDETAWMIRNRLTGQTKIPNFLDYLDPKPLRKVSPKAVRLAIPGKAPPE